MTPDRDRSFDAFRGLAIVAVVAIHASHYGFPWIFASTGSWNGVFCLAYRQLLNFAVPAFLFISGYWLSRKPVDTWADYKRFLARRLSRILVPYLFWSCLLLGYGAYQAGYVDVPRVLFKLATGNACAAYYFIVLIAQLYLLTPILQRLARTSLGVAAIGVVNAIGVLSLYVARLHFHWKVPLYLSALPFYLWMIFYVAGLRAGAAQRTADARPIGTRAILLAIVGAIVVSELEALLLAWRYDHVRFAASAVKYSSFLYSVYVVVGFLALRRYVRRWPHTLVRLGEYSFGIYLIHVIVLRKLAVLLKGLAWIDGCQPLFQGALILITVSACFGLIFVTRRLLPERFCVGVLGF